MACRFGNTVFQSYLFILFLFGLFVNINSDIASEGPSIQDLEKNLLTNLPEGLPNIPLNTSQLPSEEELKNILKEKCDRLGGPGAYARYEAAQQEVQTCVMSLVNVTELQHEVEKAKPTGDLDIVFRKYCKKSPVFLQCVNNLTATLDPCLEDREKESKRIVQNITEALLGFLCFKEGDRIALFIAEGGPECLQSKQDMIIQCANDTVAKYIPAQDASSALSQIPLLVMDEKECTSFYQFQNCVVEALETCSEPTPANIVESLFQFIVKMTPCQNFKKPEAKSSLGSNGVDSWSSSVLVLVSSLFVSKAINLL